MTKKRAPGTPIACMLSAGDLAKRARTWRSLLDNALLARERVAGGLRLTVRPEVGPQLSALVDLERNCCPWITFEVNGESVTMTAHGEGEKVLIQMFPVI